MKEVKHAMIKLFPKTSQVCHDKTMTRNKSIYLDETVTRKKSSMT